MGELDCLEVAEVECVRIHDVRVQGYDGEDGIVVIVTY